VVSRRPVEALVPRACRIQQAVGTTASTSARHEYPAIVSVLARVVPSSLGSETDPGGFVTKLSQFTRCSLGPVWHFRPDIIARGMLYPPRAAAVFWRPKVASGTMPEEGRPRYSFLRSFGIPNPTLVPEARKQAITTKQQLNIKIMKKYLTIIGLAAATLAGANATNFTVGDLAVFSADAVTNNTTFSILEINPALTSQTTSVQSIAISGTGTNALRTSGSATSTGYLTRTDDGMLLTFDAHNSATTGSNANTITARGVGSLNNAGIFALQTTYTGATGNQARGATSVDNSSWYIADQGGLYTNGASSPSPNNNLRSIKSFGGSVYALQNSSTATNIVVNTVSATSGGSITGLAGLTNSNTATDFYLLSSGTNGSTFDLLYTLGGSTLAKFSLVSGSWSPNGTATLGTSGFGLAATTSGTGANLYYTTGTGATAANSVLGLFDSAGYNTTVSLGAPTTIFTAASGTTLKGIDFAPVPEPKTWVMIGIGSWFMLWNVRRRRNLVG